MAFTSFARILGRRLSRISRYGSALIQYQPLGHDSGAVLASAQAPRKVTASSPAALKRELAKAKDGRRLILLNGNLKYCFDAEALLTGLHGALDRRDRVLVLAYSPYWAWLHRALKSLGLRSAQVPTPIS